MINDIKPFVCRDTFISAYNSLVQTNFDYCCEVWDPLGNNLSNKTPAHAFTPPAEKKMGTKWTFMYNATAQAGVNMK